MATPFSSKKGDSNQEARIPMQRNNFLSMCTLFIIFFCVYWCPTCLQRHINNTRISNDINIQACFACNKGANSCPQSVVFFLIQTLVWKSGCGTFNLQAPSTYRKGLVTHHRSKLTSYVNITTNSGWDPTAHV